MSLGRLLTLAKPQFPHLDNGDKQIDLTGLVQGLNGTPVPSRKPAFQTWQLPPLSPGSQVSFWCLDGTRGSLKSLDLLFLAVRSSPISSLFYFKKYKDLFVGSNWGTSMIQQAATDGSSQGLKEKLAEMLRNRHRHWTNPSHSASPDCCWQRGSPEVSSLGRVPTAPPLHPCPFITPSFLFSSWW